MKKLEDIPKQEIFKVPDRYFEKLPGVIQARITKEKAIEEKPFIRYSLHYALPCILLFGIGLYWLTRSNEHVNTDAILASVQTEELVSYLSDLDLTTEDVLEYVQFNEQEMETIEDVVYELHVKDIEVEDLKDEIDLDSLHL